MNKLQGENGDIVFANTWLKYFSNIKVMFNCIVENISMVYPISHEQRYISYNDHRRVVNVANHHHAIGLAISISTEMLLDKHP